MYRRISLLCVVLSADAQEYAGQTVQSIDATGAVGGGLGLVAVTQSYQQEAIFLLGWIVSILQNATGSTGFPFEPKYVTSSSGSGSGDKTNHSVLPASPVASRLDDLANRQFYSQATAGGFADAQSVFSEATTGSSIANSKILAQASKYNAILTLLKSKTQRLRTLQTRIETQKLHASHSPQHAVSATDWRMSVNNMVDGLEQSRNPTSDLSMILGLEHTSELNDLLRKMQAQVDLLQSQVHDGRNLMDLEEPKQSSQLGSKNSSHVGRRLAIAPEQQQSQSEAQVGFSAASLFTSAFEAAANTKFNVDARANNVAAVELIKDNIVDEIANFEKTRIKAMTDAESLTKERALGAERSLLEGERKHLRGVQAEPRDLFDSGASVQQPVSQPVQPQAFGQPSWREAALALLVIYLALQLRGTTQSLKNIEAMLQKQLDCANSSARKQADAPPGKKDRRTKVSCFCNSSASEDSD